MYGVLINKFFRDASILSYLILFLFIFIEGEVILLLAGILSHKGRLGISQVIMIASIAAILHDLLCEN